MRSIVHRPGGAMGSDPMATTFGPVAVAVLPFLRVLLDAQPRQERLEVLQGVVDVEYLDGEGEVAVVD